AGGGGCVARGRHGLHGYHADHQRVHGGHGAARAAAARDGRTRAGVILGVALEEAAGGQGPAPVLAAAGGGGPMWPVSGAAARTAARVCVALDLTDAPTAPVAAIRVGGPCPEALRPVADPGVATIVRGGHSLTGRRLAPLDTEAVRRFAAGC